MDKILVVARTEFANAVRTKAFLVSLLMLPVIYGVLVGIQLFANRADVEPRTFAVVDRTGKLLQKIETAAKAQNAAVVGKDGKPASSAFLPMEIQEAGRTPEEITLDLSEKVRAKDLFAFVEIPADAIDANEGPPVAIKYYSNSPNYGDLRVWVDQTISAAAREHRYAAAGIDPAVASRINRGVSVENLGLATRAATDSASGGIVSATAIDPIRSIAVPLGMAMIVYIVTLSVTPQLVSTVMEEKMSRISEMLLGSVTTFELMMGKLLGNVATAMVTTLLYIGGGYAAAARYGYADAISPGVIGTLLLFLTLSVFLFGSLYMAVGAACSELKDAQSMMMPVMMASILPMGILPAVIKNPSSAVSVASSLFPPATPILMTMRMAMSPAPPAWQVALSILLMAATTVACVWVGGKIFRTGLLMHGKAPTFREMAKWVTAR